MLFRFLSVFGILTVLFFSNSEACFCWGFDFYFDLFKYDRKSGMLTTDCPPTDGCKYGVGEHPCLEIAGYKLCPECLLGPGDECGGWKGECGKELKCQYSGIFRSTGRCVDQAEFNSRQEGQNCGGYEGNCKSGLKCKIDPFSLSGICGMGKCVTDDEFKSRDVGDSCGPMIGQCKDGLRCKSQWFGFCGLLSVCAREGGNDVIEHDITEKTNNATNKVTFEKDAELPSTENIMVGATLPAQLDTDVEPDDNVSQNNSTTSSSDTSTIHLMNRGRFKNLGDEDFLAVSDGTII